MRRSCTGARDFRRTVIGWALLLWAAIALASGSSAAAAYSPNLKRYPYLTDLVRSAATVNFATDRSHSTAPVRWARVGQESCESSAPLRAGRPEEHHGERRFGVPVGSSVTLQLIRAR
jgi:hypothetical protein